MAKQHRTRVRDGQDGLIEQSRLGEGADAVIWRSSSGASVTKSYLDQEVADQVRLAEAEFSTLLQAQSALRTISGVTCPTPYGVDRERGALVMEYCGGDQLDVALADPIFSDSTRVENLARTLSRAMVALTDEIPISQLDFSIRNTLISEDRNRIVLIDFTTRAKPATLPEGALEIECALASFLTSAITYQVRRSSLIQVDRASRLRRIAGTLIQCTSSSRELSLHRVRDIAWKYFWRQSNNRGWMRFLWFHTFGALIFWFLLRNLTRIGPDEVNEQTD